MTLTISIPPSTEARLRDIAKAAGTDVSGYVSKLLEQVVAKPSIEETLAPLRKQFSESGTSDEELIDQITAAQTAHREEHRKKTA